MRSEMFQKAISNIDDELIEAADVKKEKMKSKSLFKWASVAAAACLVIVCAFATIPNLMKTDLNNETSTANDNVAPNTQDFPGVGFFSWTEHYENVLADDRYCKYKMGNHIESNLISKKICDSIVHGGITTPRGWSPEYEFDAEIFSIVGVLPEVAVAVKSKTLTYEMKDNGKIIEEKFIEDYYVMYNPEADLIEIKDYIVTFDDPNPFLY